VLAAVAATLGIRPGSVGTALAADGLEIRADATYDLDPGERRVHVAIDFDLTNRKPSTGTTFFFYTSAFFAIQPEASNVRVTDAAGPMSITTSEKRFYTRVDIDFRGNLLFGETASFTLRYDMVGGAPRSASPVRVNRAFATFGVWAWGDKELSRVEVRVPSAYDVAVAGDRLREGAGDSGRTLSAEPAKPQTFYAIVSADNLAAYATDRVSVEGGIELVVRSWPDDDRWADSVTRTLREGMPELVELIGLDWPVANDLQVRERFTPALEGYAGFFLGDDKGIEVSEDLDSLTILHEASHAWFNNDLFLDRWVVEGLAEEYSWRTQTNLGEHPEINPKQPAINDRGRMPLDGWTFPRAIRDQDTDDRERFGYEASFWVVHTLVEAAGLDVMRDALASADDHLIAYVGAPAPEVLTGDNDWHRLVDLAQPIDEPDSAAVETAIQDWVLAAGDAAMVADRHAAREAYRELLAAGDGWLPPILVRRPMSDWRFDSATTAMEAATALLARRNEVAAAAAALGLTPDDALRSAYENATASLDDADEVATGQLDALAEIGSPKAALDTPRDLVAQIGLLGVTGPADAYAEAGAAFQRGDLAAASSSAAAVTSLIAGASQVGQQRVTLAVVVGIGLLVLLAVFAVLRRRARRRRPTTATSQAVAPDVAALHDATAPTLADPSAADWPAEDLLRPHATPSAVPPASPPEPAWWLPTRSGPDPEPTDPATLAADPETSPPPAASTPDLEGDAAERESPHD
jgi:hypothetical protein